MAFTTVEVTGTFKSQTGASAAGKLTFTLTQPMENTDVVVSPSPIVATLSAGHLTVSLYANDDPATIPQGVQYGVTEEVTGAQQRDYYIVVPHGTSPVDISTLMPGELGWT